jgi:hypothetical protein
MPWKCLPVPTDREGKAEIHYTTVYKVFAKWADDGSIEHAFVASVGHLIESKYQNLFFHEELRISHHLSLILLLPSRCPILHIKGTDNSGGEQTHGLEDIVRVYHWISGSRAPPAQ